MSKLAALFLLLLLIGGAIGGYYIYKNGITEEEHTMQGKIFFGSVLVKGFAGFISESGHKFSLYSESGEKITGFTVDYRVKIDVSDEIDPSTLAVYVMVTMTASTDKILGNITLDKNITGEKALYFAINEEKDVSYVIKSLALDKLQDQTPVFFTISVVVAAVAYDVYGNIRNGTGHAAREVKLIWKEPTVDPNIEPPVVQPPPSPEEEYKRGYAKGYDAGKADGFKDGVAGKTPKYTTKSDGTGTTYMEGYNEGYRDGYVDGYNDGKRFRDKIMHDNPFFPLPIDPIDIPRLFYSSLSFNVKEEVNYKAIAFMATIILIGMLLVRYIFFAPQGRRK